LFFLRLGGKAMKLLGGENGSDMKDCRRNSAVSNEFSPWNGGFRAG